MTSEEREPVAGSEPVPDSEPVPESEADEEAEAGGRTDGETGEESWSARFFGRPNWTREDLRRSAVAGVAAYAASYALLYLWFLTDGRMSNEFTDWRWVGWILYRGQFAPLEASPGGTSPAAASMVESQLGALENVAPALLLSLAAVGTAGFLLARARTDVESSLAAKTGASLVLGYLPPAVLGVVVFSGTLPNGIHVRPSPVWGPVVVGLVFPGVVGALGGLAFVYRERRTNEEPRQPAGDEAPEVESPEVESPEARS